MAWITKDELQGYILFEEKPFREQQGSYWNSNGRFQEIDHKSTKWLFTHYDFSKLSWEDEPIEVEVQVKPRIIK